MLEALERQDYDVVLMDIEMPELDGLEATERIKALLPPERCPRIVAVTANAMAGDRERFLAAGMDDYISKPIRVEAIVEALKSVSAGKADAKAARPAATGPIDATSLDTLLDIVGGDHEALADLTESFLATAPALAEALQSSAKTGDVSEFRRAAHTLKSSAFDFGATALAETCALLEKRAKEDAAIGTHDDVQKAVAQFEEAETALRTILADLRDSEGASGAAAS